MLVILCGVGKNNQIGLNGQLPWYVKEDLMFFKAMTLHQKVVFGRVTYQQLPPLKNRDIYIVSRSNLAHKQVISDFDQFLRDHENDEEVYFICGGEKVYQQALPYCKYIILSRIDYDQQADTYFPVFDHSLYNLEKIVMNTFTIEVYVRRF